LHGALSPFFITTIKIFPVRIKNMAKLNTQTPLFCISKSQGDKKKSVCRNEYGSVWARSACGSFRDVWNVKHAQGRQVQQR
jgi:hypothetical protein